MAVVVIMVSSPPCGGCGGGNGFIHPLWCGRGCGVAVVLVMVVAMVIRLQEHVEASATVVPWHVF